MHAPQHTPQHSPREEYAGPARLSDPDRPADQLEVRVELRGRFEPIDGHFHWWGRIDADPRVEGTHRSGSTVLLDTPHGTARGRVSDLDPWGRYRISGTGQPPF